MPSGWEGFAQEDAQRYIDPRLGPGASTDEFIEGGRAVVERALEFAGELPGRERALEIGCGVGRDTAHLAEHFAQVDGVDVSETMVRLASERGLPANVRLHVVSGQDLSAFGDDSFDYVFSHLVFQHVADDAVVDAYLRETARVLKPGAVATLQFDTRPSSLVVRLVQWLPDPLLARERRRDIRRYRRPAAAIRASGAAAGLSLEGELDPETAEHWFRWRAVAA